MDHDSCRHLRCHKHGLSLHPVLRAESENREFKRPGETSKQNPGVGRGFDFTASSSTPLLLPLDHLNENLMRNIDLAAPLHALLALLLLFKQLFLSGHIPSIKIARDILPESGDGL